MDEANETFEELRSRVQQPLLDNAREATEQIHAWIQRRNDAMREAHAKGVTMRALAEAASVATTTVHEIIHDPHKGRRRIRTPARYL